MLKGTYEHNLDPKGRLILAKQLREEIGDAFVITKGFDNCLHIYSTESYNATAERVMALPDSDEDARYIKQEFLGNAHDCEADKQGRFVVPPILRKEAGLIKDVVIIGSGAYVKVWSAEALEEYKNGSEEKGTKPKNYDQATKNLAAKGMYF